MGYVTYGNCKVWSSKVTFGTVIVLLCKVMQCKVVVGYGKVKLGKAMLLWCFAVSCAVM